MRREFEREEREFQAELTRAKALGQIERAIALLATAEDLCWYARRLWDYSNWHIYSSRRRSASSGTSTPTSSSS
ncbi:MAG TPA: hypothetical protein VKD90_19085 [Gemmataceae bacterium]|nr:hypothetical protein [Gemmataceae bacterium]